MNSKPIRLIAQLDKIITTKDGSHKLMFECGYESLQGIQQIQNILGNGELNFCVHIYAEGEEPNE